MELSYVVVLVVGMCLLSSIEGLSVELMSYDSHGENPVAYLDGDDVIHVQNDSKQWICVVKATDIKPDVWITLGGQNITDKFTIKNTAKYLADSGVTEHEHTLGARDVIVDNNDTDQELKCLASQTVGDVVTMVTKSVNIKAGYKPRFTCEQTIYAR